MLPLGSQDQVVLVSVPTREGDGVDVSYGGEGWRASTVTSSFAGEPKPSSAASTWSHRSWGSLEGTRIDSNRANPSLIELDLRSTRPSV
jgi:hypothetical protein